MNRAQVRAVHVADWTADPWARGGYAYGAVESGQRASRELLEDLR
jgi:monoamine oxidase